MNSEHNRGLRSIFFSGMILVFYFFFFVNLVTTFFRYTEPYLIFKPTFWPPLLNSYGDTKKSAQNDLYEFILHHPQAKKTDAIAIVTNGFNFFEYELIFVPHPTSSYEHFQNLTPHLGQNLHRWILIESAQVTAENKNMLSQYHYELKSENSLFSLWQRIEKR